MQWSPSVPRRSDSAAACASSSSARLTPKLRLVPRCRRCDWNTRSTGAPSSMACSVFVTCVSTQVWVGTPCCCIMSSSRCSRAHQRRHAVGRGVDADDRVAGAVHQAVEDAGDDAGRAVGGVVGLQPHRQVPGQAQRVAEMRDDAAPSSPPPSGPGCASACSPRPPSRASGPGASAASAAVWRRLTTASRGTRPRSGAPWARRRRRRGCRR
jgi:hypothetical protein